MALTELIFGEKRTLDVGVVQFDCSVSETHNHEVDVTSHPVEDGADVSDHIRKLPVGLEINGLVTNTPVIFLASLQAPSPIWGDLKRTTDRVDAAYEKLQEIMDNGEMVDVVTSLKLYENMAITSLSVVRDVDRGNVLDCTMSLREIILAKKLTIDLPTPKEVANKIAQNKGKKGSKAASAKEASKMADTGSIAASLLGL